MATNSHEREPSPRSGRLRPKLLAATAFSKSPTPSPREEKEPSLAQILQEHDKKKERRAVSPASSSPASQLGSEYYPATSDKEQRRRKKIESRVEKKRQLLSSGRTETVDTLPSSFTPASMAKHSSQLASRDRDFVSVDNFLSEATSAEIGMGSSELRSFAPAGEVYASRERERIERKMEQQLRRQQERAASRSSADDELRSGNYYGPASQSSPSSGSRPSRKQLEEDAVNRKKGKADEVADQMRLNIMKLAENNEKLDRLDEQYKEDVKSAGRYRDGAKKLEAYFRDRAGEGGGKKTGADRGEGSSSRPRPAGAPKSDASAKDHGAPKTSEEPKQEEEESACSAM
ncbi:unnamed protein product [Amoebophrya sp. A120]|nr:unnamed protein product [Amoebophrya sp. A120]|eukprot:GSA120T00004758001.1